MQKNVLARISLFHDTASIRTYGTTATSYTPSSSQQFLMAASYTLPIIFLAFPHLFTTPCFTSSQSILPPASLPSSPAPPSLTADLSIYYKPDIQEVPQVVEIRDEYGFFTRLHALFQPEFILQVEELGCSMKNLSLLTISCSRFALASCFNMQSTNFKNASSTPNPVLELVST